MDNIAGYLASGLIGISLGLIGGGGSLITIPVLVYLFHIEPALATTYSLFIVGTTSVIGGMRSSLNKTVDFKAAIIFTIPSTLSIYVTRHFLLPHIPDLLFSASSFSITKNTAIMIFFSFMMITAAVRMINNKEKVTSETSGDGLNIFLISIQGLVVGIISGIVGAGGGFLIIPSLVLLAGLPMKKAIGTSLVIIAINALIGFVGDAQSIHQVNFPLMFILSALAITGVFIGIYLSKFVNGKSLKSGFGWFALTMAVYIIVKEIV